MIKYIFGRLVLAIVGEKCIQSARGQRNLILFLEGYEPS